MNFIKNLKVCPSLFFMNICREGLADKSCSCLTFEHFIELDKLYQTTDTELNRLFIKRRKREKELEKKKSVLTTMYDELQRLRDDIELTEKLLRALEKEYYETRNEMSSVLQSGKLD
ncbi:uncharacterized protein LOC106868687 [Octopus bimaculoides]|uniref:Uncharacterized protein n=1 Tax=Octopus bimaculoides TaxID=37653 RepID=A0A0L8IFN7_OCTBM|nr:uncharacterized protein LOC106868687 [Octopus bimaculoides]|eukprot:XP_014769563.1 PREDICTED: uncharacterized protein LOC106868687 [Octopus bimaculoides]